MEKICLIRVGNYLLGIDISVVHKKQKLSSFIAEEQGDEISLILLGPLFDYHTTVLPDSEGCILEVKSTAGSLILVIDSFSAKTVAFERSESLPRLYPDLTKICCPQIMICENQPVLLLDVNGLETVLESVKNNSAVISLATLREHCCKEKEVQVMQSAVELDEVTFNTIVSWTIAEFLKHGNDEDCVITPDELLLKSISHGGSQGVSNDLLQRLIDKTVQKCSKFHNTAMQQLRQTSALADL
ncbi:MAG: hypothetical protein DSY80_05485 [Desulfocapsa sp.]|nr:MAG: hypothetical protein DSY80_05485 [Desulfocapsa sp.]